MPQRILVVDDEVHITRAVQMKLSRAGYDIETAPDGQAAWESFQRSPPDLLISDCQMPRMGGIELCRRIRETPGCEQLPIILLTAKGYELDEDGVVLDLWLSALIGKPFSPRELLETVQGILSGADTEATKM
ncbi:MAG: response regulator [Planctomycetaceae bacterium]